MKKQFLVIFLAIGYFVIGLFYLHDYGITWDSPYNFQRGEAILHYFLTGQKDYHQLSKCQYLQGSDFIARNTLRSLCPQKNGLLRSYYQDDLYGYKFTYQMDRKYYGHPPLGGIMAAVTNTIFYKWLGVMDDTDSHNLSSLIMSAVLVLIVGLWATQVYGMISGVISGLSLCLYPILFGERNFNFKDPPVVTLYVLALYFIWLSFQKRQIKYLIISSLFSGLSLSIKFNIVFAPFIVLPWLLYLLLEVRNYSREFLTKAGIFFLFYPLVSVIIFYMVWPFWWSTPLEGLKTTIQYYKDIGLGIQYQDATYYFGGFNIYPIEYILFTTPIHILLLALSGIICVIKNIRQKTTSTAFLWMFLFLIPIARVTLPHFSSYGGVRQILEFAPGMALLAGYAMYVFSNSFKTILYARVFVGFIVLSFIPIIITLIRIHPNENLYFNMLIGGIKGAQEKNFPGWQNTFGNDYYQGVAWLNKHAPSRAKLTYSIQGMHNYVPFTKVRPDMQISEDYWSDSKKEGEYIIEANLDQALINKYAKQYELISLIPLYTLSVDNIPIGYVFKNDKEHTKKQFQKDETEIPITSIKSKDLQTTINLDTSHLLTKIVLSYNSSCREIPDGTISILDKMNWRILPEPLGEQYYTLPNFAMGRKDNTIIYYIPFDGGKTVKIDLFSQNAKCNTVFSKIILKGIH